MVLVCSFKGGHQAASLDPRPTQHDQRILQVHATLMVPGFESTNSSEALRLENTVQILELIDRHIAGATPMT